MGHCAVFKVGAARVSSHIITMLWHWLILVLWCFPFSDMRSVFNKNCSLRSVSVLWFQMLITRTANSADSSAVNGSHYTWWSKAPASRATREGRLIIHNTGGSRRGRRRKETVTLHQPPRDTKMVQYWVLATNDRWCHTPSTSRQWWWQSQLSIILIFLQINQS